MAGRYGTPANNTIKLYDLVLRPPDGENQLQTDCVTTGGKGAN